MIGKTLHIEFTPEQIRQEIVSLSAKLFELEEKLEEESLSAYEEYFCPITKHIMQKPVTTSSGSGRCFEESAIIQWENTLRLQNRSVYTEPESRAEFTPGVFIPSRNILAAIERNHPLVPEIARTKDKLKRLNEKLATLEKSQQEAELKRSANAVSVATESRTLSNNLQPPNHFAGTYARMPSVQINATPVSRAIQVPSQAALVIQHSVIARNQRSYDLQSKIIITGDHCNGLISNYLQGCSDYSYTSSYNSTIGVNFIPITIEVDGKRVRLQSWYGFLLSRPLTNSASFCHKSHGIIIVLDVTNEASLLNIRNLLKDVERYAAKNVSKILVGGNIEDISDRVVTKESAQALADEFGMVYFECSRRNYVNTTKAFVTLTQQILQKIPRESMLIEERVAPPVESKQCSIL